LPTNTTLLTNWAAARVVGWSLALALLAAGLATLVAALIPLRFGNIDSEVGALGETAATGSLLLIGVAATLFVAAQTRRRGVVLGSALLSIGLAVVLIGGLLLLALDLPIVLRSAQGMAPVPARAVKVAVAKSLALLGIEVGALVALGFLGFRWWFASKRSSNKRVLAP